MTIREKGLPTVQYNESLPPLELCQYTESYVHSYLSCCFDDTTVAMIHSLASKISVKSMWCVVLELFIHLSDLGHHT